MHDIADANEGFAERAARMEFAVLIGRETTPLHQRDRERIAQHKHQRRRRRRRKSHWAGFPGARQEQRHVGRAQQRRIPTRRNPDQRDRETLCKGDEVREFRRLARIGQDHQGVIPGDGAEVAVARFRWMHKMCGRAGRGEGGGDFARHVSRLPHAADDHAALAAEDRVHRATEASVERFAQSVDGFAGAVEHALRRAHIRLHCACGVGLRGGRYREAWTHSVTQSSNRPQPSTRPAAKSPEKNSARKRKSCRRKPIMKAPAAAFKRGVKPCLLG